MDADVEKAADDSAEETNTEGQEQHDGTLKPSNRPKGIAGGLGLQSYGLVTLLGPKCLHLHS